MDAVHSCSHVVILMPLSVPMLPALSVFFFFECSCLLFLLLDLLEYVALQVS